MTIGKKPPFRDSVIVSTLRFWRRSIWVSYFLPVAWGHNKDHRPDLKQLLYTLTVSHDGNVPVYFTSHSGNVADDTTHVATWDLLCQLVGGPDFL